MVMLSENVPQCGQVNSWIGWISEYLPGVARSWAAALVAVRGWGLLLFFWKCL